MFKSAATKLAHSSAVRAVAPGNSDLRPLQEVITTEKVVLQSLQKLSTDFGKSIGTLRAWAGGEGEDLEDTFSACATLLYHWVSSLASFADNIANVRECLKTVRTREEALGEMRRNRRTLMSKADSTDKRLNKMSSGDKNFQQQTGLLTGLREQINALDAEIIDEEASLYDAKRDKAREWMNVLLGGLLECSATGAVVATSGRTIIECVPTEATQPGLPRDRYSGHSQVELLVAEAERTIRKISTIGEAGISFGSEAGVSVVSGVDDETSQLPNESGVGNVPGNQPSTLSLPIQPTPVQPIQPYTSSTLPNNRPSDPHELNDFGERNPYPQSQTYTPGRWPHVPLLDEPVPAIPAGPSVFTPSHPPRPLGLTQDISGLHSTSSSSQIRPTSHQLAQEILAIEEQIMLDAEIAKHLQDADGDGDGAMDEMQDADWMLDSGTHVLSENTEMWSDAKGKARAQDEPEHPVSNLYPICGICLEQFQVTHSPISASLTANSSARLPFGLRLPCPGEHTYCVSCVSEYIKRKLDPSGTDEANTNITVFPIACPECPIADWGTGIQTDVAERIFDAESMSVWHHRKLLDSLPKRYCPNPKCSVLVQIDEDYIDPKAQCPACFQWACIPCESAWHNNMTCEKYQSLPLDERSPEDQALIELAKTEKWRRCPGCQAIVERNQGCNHMTCLCGMEFCFRCGSLWCTRLKKCTNDPPCELFGEGVFLDPGEMEGADNAHRRPASPPPPSPSPPPIARRRSFAHSPPRVVGRRLMVAPPPRGRSITPPPIYGRVNTRRSPVRRPLTPPSPPSPPPELQRGQVRPSKLQKRSVTKDGSCVTQ